MVKLNYETSGREVISVKELEMITKSGLVIISETSFECAGFELLKGIENREDNFFSVLDENPERLIK